MRYFLRVIPNKPQNKAVFEVECTVGDIPTKLDQALKHMGFDHKNEMLYTRECDYADQDLWVSRLSPLLEVSEMTLTKKIWIEKLGGWFEF